MSTIGIVCDNTCFNYGPGDDTPTQIYGVPFQNLGGMPFALDFYPTDYTLTINGITHTEPLSTITATVDGWEVHIPLVNNVYGIAFEQQELCVTTPGVPEPATNVLLAIGMVALAVAFYQRRKVVTL